eukprot:scaffold1397_cov254-Pinguiococcus_pyrenoidosus.AAC.23
MLRIDIHHFRYGFEWKIHAIENLYFKSKRKSLFSALQVSWFAQLPLIQLLFMTSSARIALAALEASKAHLRSMEGPEVQALYQELRKAVLRENWDRIGAVCGRLRRAVGDDADVLKSECVALLQQKRFEAALELAAKHDFLSFEKAYALYRLGRHDDARRACQAASSDENPAFQHLNAQLDYREGDFERAKLFYKDFVTGQADQTEELDDAAVHDATVNYLATLGGTADCAGLDECLDGLDEVVQDDYEVAYNAGVVLSAATAEGGMDKEAATEAAAAAAGAAGAAGAAAGAAAAAAVSRAASFLRRARELCISTLEDEGLGQDEIAEECGIMDIALSFMLLHENAKDAVDLCMNALQRKSGRPVDMSVAANNLTVLRGKR